VWAYINRVLNVKAVAGRKQVESEASYISYRLT
jgi:hypothetical protein